MAPLDIAYSTRTPPSTDSALSAISSPPSSASIISSPIGPPWLPPLEHPKQPSRLTARMPGELSVNSPQWLSGLRSALRTLVTVLSGAVTYFLVHSLEVYRGNISLDLRKGELPMTWPARTNLAPTIVLILVAAANFLASVAILTLSFKKSFRRPIRSRDVYRIVAGSFGVVLWTTALVVFSLLDKASKASLGRYACTNRDIMSNGRFQYRTICSEQGIAFYLAIGASSAEALTLLTLALSVIHSTKTSACIRREEKDSIAYGSPKRYPC